MKDLSGDLRYGIRMLVKNPGFTAVAVLTLALGIGANTAIFSVVESILLRPLPYKDPERLVTIWETDLNEGTITGSVSTPDFVDWRDQSRAFVQMAAIASASFNMTGRDEPLRVQAVRASASFFPLLGVRATAGRTFLPEEDQPGHEQVAVLSHAFWQRHLRADPNVVGDSLTLNDREFTVW